MTIRAVAVLSHWEGCFNLGIRKYESSDLTELLDVWYDASRLAHPFLDDAFFDAERRRIPEKYLPITETWVHEGDGCLVGFIAMLGDEIGALFVAPACHRRAIGRGLVDHVRGSRSTLEVEVFKANLIGRAFYDRYGFEPMHEHIHDETGHALIRMRWPERGGGDSR